MQYELRITQRKERFKEIDKLIPLDESGRESWRKVVDFKD